MKNTSLEKYYAVSITSFGKIILLLVENGKNVFMTLFLQDTSCYDSSPIKLNAFLHEPL